MRHPLTILQVITQRRYSGAERICLALCEDLQRRGHRVVLLCKQNGDMPEIARSAGIDTKTPAISGKLNLLAPLRIAAIAREIKADVIHTHLSTAGMWGTLAGRLAGVPVVAHVHAMNSKHCYQFADRIITCSSGVREHLVAQGVSPKMIQVVYNGIDLRRFENTPDGLSTRVSLGLPSDAPVIGCVAHLSAKKGQEFLIRAVALLRDRWPELHCLLVGEGDMTGELQHLAADLGVAENIHLLGFRSDAAAVMNAMDIVVLPSIAKEGLGLALVEAAILEKPTVASNAPGIDEALMDGVSGILVPPGNPEQLAEALDRLLADRELRKRMGVAGHRRALEKFTIPAMTDGVEAVYRELVAV
jgi:glycosyltransferase involved in cell wall biosynthesis